MTYEETMELEENVKIKNKADDIYKRFNKFVVLYADKFDHENNRFTISKDSNNATYLSIGGVCFTYQCRFLHENYNCDITPSAIFGYIKKDCRGFVHLEAMIRGFEKTENDS